MSKYDRIFEIAHEHNGIFTFEMLKKESIPGTYISQLIKKKEIYKIAPGVYVLLDADADEMYFFQLRYPRSVFSFHTALVLHGLSDVRPETYEITLPKGYNPYRLKGQPVIPHFSASHFFDLGKTEVKTIYGNTVTVYDAERTLCDILRNRKTLDDEMIGKAFRLYQTKTNRDYPKLREYAKRFRISSEIDQILEVLS